ncbi:MAG: radical SAM protein [Nanoarchaeota archaeon]|nr:radical SAM protein [Nanoarchaeota archaeon]
MGLKHEYKTISRCLHCLKPVNAKYVEKNNKLFLKKLCDKCGTTSILIENNASFLEKSYLLPLKKTGLKVGKHVNYVVLLYLTDKCNNNCKICLSHGLPKGDMTLKRIEELCEKHDQKFFLLLGGEPTLREDLFNIIKFLKKEGKEPLLFTNGLKLSNLDYVKKLKAAGLKIVYFSLDCLSERINQKITGRKNVLEKKLRALKNLEDENLSIIISSRLIGGFNEDEVKKLIDLAVNSVAVKELWFYPVVDIGRVEMDKTLLFASDAVKLIEKHSNFRVKLDDFIEFKRFLINAYGAIRKTFLKRLNTDSILSHSYTLPVRKKNFSPIITAEEVKSINGKLEGLLSQKKHWTALLILTRFLINKKLFFLSISSFLNRYFNVIKRCEDLLLLNIYVVTSPKTFDFNNQLKEIEYAGKDAKLIKFY